MDSKAELYIKRARAELDMAALLFACSGNEILGKFDIDSSQTFYSGAIAHSYYAIFYSAKAMLLTKNITTESPEIHRKTFDEFEKSFIKTGILDIALLEIYRELVIRAETLLEIFREEKRKRGNYTYNTIAQANRPPAENSIKNAKTFFKHCQAYLNAN